MDKIEHPLRVLRVMAGLTQRQLADRVASRDNFPEDLSEQYIRRAEHGLVGDDTNLAPIVGCLLATIKSRHDLEDRIDVHAAVETVKGLLGMGALRYAADRLLDCEQNMHGVDYSEQIRRCIKDWYYLQRIAARSGFRSENFPTHFDSVSAFRQEVSRRLGTGTSLYSFCRTLALHLFVIQRFEKTTKSIDNASEWPKDLRTALGIIGVDLSQITIGGNNA